MTKIVFDCTQVSFFLHQFIDGEADEATCAAMRLHLQGCQECEQSLGAGQSVKALVARACGCEEAPANLREKVTITRASVEIEQD